MNESNAASNIEAQLPKKKSRAFLWLVFTLLIALTAAGLYLWHWLDNALSQQQTQLATLQQQLSHLQETTQTHNQQIIAAAKQAQTLQDMAQQAIDLSSRRQKGWVLAEVDYLMRIANRRLQISHDINGAVAALQGADQGLHETGDLSLLPVRQQLAKELAALKALRQVDIDGIALTLDQMSDHVNALPFMPVDAEIRAQLPATPATENATAAPEKSLADSIIDTIMAIGNIKIHHRGVKPASDAQQQYQSEHKLLSHLASARLAALRFDAKQFVYDINLAQQTLSRFYDVNDNRVAQMIKDLASYSNIELAPKLPEINTSWRMLQTARSKIVESAK